MTRASRWCRRSSAAIALAIALASMVSVGSPPDAQAAPADPSTAVLAIVSPIASPACSASGSATLLVPIVGGLVNQNLPKSVPTIADVLLDAIGPVYVACGQLPSAPGSRCLIDDQIAALVPVEVSSLTGPTPGVLGDVTDALNAALKLLGLQPADALRKALVCEVPGAAGGVDAPPALPVAAPPVLPAPIGTTPAPATRAAAPSIAPASRAAAPATPAPAAPAPTTSAPRQTLAAAVADQLPGGLRTLQVILGLALALYFASSWTTSWREARRYPDR